MGLDKDGYNDAGRYRSVEKISSSVVLMLPEEDKRDKEKRGGGVEEEGVGLCAACPPLSSLLSDIMTYHQMVHH